MKHQTIKYLAAFILMATFNTVFSQQRKIVEVDSQIVAAVKKDVWIPFMESYRDLDGNKLKSVHTTDITRVSLNTNKIESGSDYLDNQAYMFSMIKKMNRQMRITFSIVSTATSKDKVYQTGYYIFSSKKADDEHFTPRGYSFFSVLITKDQESNTWKISLDADKKVSITQEEFMKSGTIYALDE